jgi:DNA-binding NarL/FixJ family response regulator
MTAIRVALADDHHLIRASLRALIGGFQDIEVVGDAGDGQQALSMIAACTPDVVLMDIVMTGLNGLEATRRSVKSHPASRIIMLSMHAGEDYVLPALQAGAVGYLLKQSSPAELEGAIHAVARGDMVLSPAISRQVIERFLGQNHSGSDALTQLTPRQRQILQLIAEGQSSRQIALRLGCSSKTVESHRASLMQRLDIHAVAGLVRFAIRNGLVSPED